MTEHVRVEITRRVVPADEATLAKRAEIVERMRNLGHLDAQAEGAVSETMDDGYVARIGEVVFPVVTFSVEPGGEDSAGVLVSLLVPVGSVQVGISRSAASASQVPAVPEQKPAVSTWGAAKVDPRENIPGWKPDMTGPSVSAPARGVLA